MVRKEATRDDLAVVVGTGHLGVNLVKALVDEGREVRVVAYNGRAIPDFLVRSSLPIKIFLGDVSNKEYSVKTI